MPGTKPKRMTIRLICSTSSRHRTTTTASRSGGERPSDGFIGAAERHKNPVIENQEQDRRDPPTDGRVEAIPDQTNGNEGGYNPRDAATDHETESQQVVGSIRRLVRASSDHAYQGGEPRKCGCDLRKGQQCVRVIEHRP